MATFGELDGQDALSGSLVRRENNDRAADPHPCTVQTEISGIEFDKPIAQFTVDFAQGSHRIARLMLRPSIRHEDILQQLMKTATLAGDV
jgi:hypothetical protein